MAKSQETQNPTDNYTVKNQKLQSRIFALMGNMMQVFDLLKDLVTKSGTRTSTQPPRNANQNTTSFAQTTIPES